MLKLIRGKWLKCVVFCSCTCDFKQKKNHENWRPNRLTKITSWKFKQDILFLIKSMIKLKWDITIMINRIYKGLHLPYIKQADQHDVEKEKIDYSSKISSWDRSLWLNINFAFLPLAPPTISVTGKWSEDVAALNSPPSSAKLSLNLVEACDLGHEPLFTSGWSFNTSLQI